MSEDSIKTCIRTSPYHKDIFTDAWGGNTKYKNVRPRRHHYGWSNDGTSADIQPSAADGIRPKVPPLQLNKPLPPLPKESPDLPTPLETPQDAVDLQNVSRRQTPAPLAVTNRFNLKKTMGSIRGRPKKQSPEKALQPEAAIRPYEMKAAKPPPSPPPRRSSIQPPLEPVKCYVYVNKGTQTSPTLLPMPSVATIAPVEPFPLSPRDASETKRQSTNSPAATNLQSPTSPKGAVLSPRNLWTKVAPQDYFSLPFRSDSQRSSSRSQGSSTENGKRASTADMSSATGSQHRRGSSKSGDSIGTYESRYSEPTSEPVPSSTIPTRPSIGGRAHTLDSVLNSERAITAPPMTRKVPGRPKIPNRGISTQSNARPLSLPFNRLTSFSAGSRRRNISASETSSRSSPGVSPLRNFIRMPESPPDTADAMPPTPGFFRQPVITPEGQPEDMSYYIPDHLKGSPLCPRSPKHPSGGTGFCPMHGQNESPALRRVSEDGHHGDSTLTMFIQVSPTGTQSSGGRTDGSDAETVRPFILGAFRHDATDPDCPANALVRGTCVYHGRGKGLVSDISEESVPRSRLLVQY